MKHVYLLLERLPLKEVDGYFTISYPDGLKPNEYCNEMLMYCDRIKVNYNDVEAISNGSIKAVQYLVPNN